MEDGSYQNVTVTADGASASAELYGYEMNAYLLHRGEDDLILLDSMADNDYHTLWLFRISDGGVTFEGTVEGHGVCRNSLTDPEHFALDSRLNALGTYSGVRYYRLSDGGAGLEPVEADYAIYGQRQITSAMELAVDVLGSDGQTDKTGVKIPAGTVFTLTRTDGSGYVDASLTDGRVCRLYVSTEAWPYTVNGVDVNEAFGDLMFAG